MKKICKICGKEFETLQYGSNRQFCFECSPSYDKNSNKERGQNITHIRRAIKKQLVEYKGGKCELCGYDKCIKALQFHHKDSMQKDFEIADFYNSSKFDIERLKNEVDKCTLLCSNCHIEIHDIENFKQ